MKVELITKKDACFLNQLRNGACFQLPDDPTIFMLICYDYDCDDIDDGMLLCVPLSDNEAEAFELPLKKLVFPIYCKLVEIEKPI